MLGFERFHRERAGTIGVDDRRRADAVLPHERAEAREKRRQLLGRRVRAREQRVLQHASRRRVDDDGDAIDGGGGHDLVKELTGTLILASADSYGGSPFQLSVAGSGGIPTTTYPGGTLVAQGILNIQDGSALGVGHI